MRCTWKSVKEGEEEPLRIERRILKSREWKHLLKKLDLKPIRPVPVLVTPTLAGSLANTNFSRNSEIVIVFNYDFINLVGRNLCIQTIKHELLHVVMKINRRDYADDSNNFNQALKLMKLPTDEEFILAWKDCKGKWRID